MKLNLGSGLLGSDRPWSKGTGWINMDVAAYETDKGDWTKADYIDWDMNDIPWKFDNGNIISENSMEAIFASHVLEHFQYDRIMPILGESKRVLKPGAPMRIICPDPRKFVANYQIRNKQYVLECFGTEANVKYGYQSNLNLGFTDMFFPDHYDHAVCLSVDTLMIMLIRVGFTDVYEMVYTNTKYPECFGAASVDSGISSSMDNRPTISYYVEAVK